MWCSAFLTKPTLAWSSWIYWISSGQERYFNVLMDFIIGGGCLASFFFSPTSSFSPSAEPKVSQTEFLKKQTLRSLMCRMFIKECPWDKYLWKEWKQKWVKEKSTSMQAQGQVWPATWGAGSGGYRTHYSCPFLGKDGQNLILWHWSVIGYRPPQEGEWTWVRRLFLGEAVSEGLPDKGWYNITPELRQQVLPLKGDLSGTS